MKKKYIDIWKKSFRAEFFIHFKDVPEEFDWAMESIDGIVEHERDMGMSKGYWLGACITALCIIIFNIF